MFSEKLQREQRSPGKAMNDPATHMTPQRTLPKFCFTLDRPEIEQDFPKAFYGDWRRVSYVKCYEKDKPKRMKNARQLFLSFRRTYYDFVRTTQWQMNRRLAVTWIVDGEWHESERITVESENKLVREVQIDDRIAREVMVVKDNVLFLKGFNGIYAYQAAFVQMHPPLRPILEEDLSEGDG